MATYFGNNSNGDDYNVFGLNYYNAAGYACPDTGPQDVLALDGNAQDAGTSGNMRCAIFTAAGAFVMQWDAEYRPSGAGWLSKSAFVDQGGSPIATPQLTGGDTYLLCLTGDGGDFNTRYHAVASGLGKHSGAEYTGGFPANLPASSDATRSPCIRCLVEPAAAGGSQNSMPYLMQLRKAWAGWTAEKRWKRRLSGILVPA